MDFKKNWTTYLGVVFFLAAFAYLLQISIEADWFTPTVKITIGLIFSGALMAAGASLIFRGSSMLGQFVAGSGVAVTATTFSFAGIYYEIWSPMTVFIAMIPLVAVTSWFSYQYSLRILMNTSLLGAVVAPMLLRPETDQVFTLFLYLLILNVAYFFVSVQKRWSELYVTAFFATWLLYLIYMIQFHPDVNHWFALPIRYAFAAFIFYHIALAWSSWQMRKSVSGLPLYLSVFNGIFFVLWLSFLLQDVGGTIGQNATSITLLLTGFMYLLLSIVVYRLDRQMVIPFSLYLYGGITLIMQGISQMLNNNPFEVVINVFLWLGFSVILIFLANWQRIIWLFYMSQIVWAIVLLYWFITTWGSTHGDWLGFYVPFMNNGALAWILLAAMGFFFSIKMKDGLEYIFAVISHLVVGGLLTVQIMNIWEFYELKGISMLLSLSIVWGIYALLLFLWGAYRQENLYRIFGSIVLVIVAVKAIFIDLWGSDNVYKIIVLLILGAISFIISFINNRWKTKDVEAEKN
jgi:uncharacterized membrane protein